MGDEACDDADDRDGDGCSAHCQLERGWTCDAQSPSHCAALCGDGLRVGREACDDGSALAGDGCTNECLVRRGWVCSDASPSVCIPRCGDGLLSGDEGCDDGNLETGDGCDASCRREPGFACDAASGLCTPICGDGQVVADEACDDGNTDEGDGCSSVCTRSSYWRPIFAINAVQREVNLVWTGREVLSWGWSQSGALVGLRFDPAQDIWRAMNPEGAPSSTFGRAFWTGTEMIICCGLERDSRMARYVPARDAWTWIPAPEEDRFFEDAANIVWTGTELLVRWRYSDETVAGFRFDPALETWTAMSEENAPPFRARSTAVWTGREMIVWGGESALEDHHGAAYDPVTDTWRSIALAPIGPRSRHSAIWTGGEMIIFGGTQGHQPAGASYEPMTDSWRSLPEEGAPSTRVDTAAVWTGSELVIFGGFDDSPEHLSAQGFSFAPATQRWSPITAIGAPTPRFHHSGVWTGEEVVFWGGEGAYTANLDDGGAYSPRSRAWRRVMPNGTPAGRDGHTAVWTGSDMIIHGGRNFGDDCQPAPGPTFRYEVDANRFVSIESAQAPPSTVGHSATFVGSEMLVFGGITRGPGFTCELPLMGRRLDTERGTWRSMNPIGQPGPRTHHAAVFTGESLLIFGGLAPDTLIALGDGARYDPVRDLWTPISAVGAPSPRSDPVASWTGEEMIIFGGSSDLEPLGDGARYDPRADRWTPISMVGAPSPRTRSAAVWTGRELIVFGGAGDSGRLFGDGARYDPLLDGWSAISPNAAPSPREEHSAIWTGTNVIVWGGRTGDLELSSSGARYDPAADRWTPLPNAGAPSPRTGHTSIWTGTRMVVWGGRGSLGELGDGAWFVP